MRASPAELPYSAILLAILIPVELGLDAYSLHEQFKTAPQIKIVLASLSSMIVFIGIVYFLLTQRKLQSRFNKFLIAWFATELLLGGLFKALLFIIPEGQLKELQQLLILVYVTWDISIKIYIIRRTIEIKVLNALLMTLGIYMVSLLPQQLILNEYIQQLLLQQQQQEQEQQP
jgi:hypothetical protein